jgi:hypothetical protein
MTDGDFARLIETPRIDVYLGDRFTWRMRSVPQRSQAVALFGEPNPSDHRLREAALFKNGEATELDQKLEALTNEVDDGAIQAAMLRIAKDAGILPQ